VSRKRTRTFAGCLAVLVLGTCFTLATATSAAAQEDTAPEPAIRSAAEIDYPPFSLVGDNGVPDGFSVELLRAALAAMDRKVTFRTGPWAEVRSWLERGEVQALPLVGRTPEREALFDFTVPYMTLHGAIVVPAEETGIRDLADLRGRSVAVMKGDNVEEFLRREDRGIDLRTSPTFEAALQELAAGRHDAVVVQRLVALRLIQQAGLTDLRVLDRPVEDFEQDFCFAVREGDRETLALLNEGLALVMADGTYRHLHAKWFAAMQLPSSRPIVIGGDRNFPPYEFLDEDGRPSGYNVDLTRAIAREMGLNVEIRLGHWPERMQALASGRIDALQGMYYSTDRDLRFDFTPAHAVSHYVAVVRAGEGPPPESVEDLAGKQVVVERDDILHDFAVEHGLTDRLVVVDDQEEALKQLVAGRYDCALVSRATVLFLMERHGWTGLLPARKPLLVPEYCYATAAGQAALLAQISEGLRALESSGEYRRIHDEWLGIYQDEGSSLLDILRLSARIIIPLALVLLVVLVWSWTLRRQVDRKTGELRESLDRFRNVFESSNVGKSITRPTGEVHANRAFARFLGHEPDELRGKRWQDLTPPEDVEVIEAAIAPLLAGEEDSVRFEKRYIHRSGEFLWADVSAALHRDGDGCPLYFVTTVVDINDRKRAEAALRRSEEYQRAMIACSPVALYTVDLEGTVLSWNSSAERIFGWSADEVLGRPLPIVPAGKRGEFDDLRRLALDEGGFSGRELDRVRKDGTAIPISLSVALVRNDGGEMVGILGAAEDIAERREATTRLEWNLHRNELLSDMAARLLRSDDPQVLVEEICTRVMDFIDCQAFFNFLEDPARGRLHLNACAGISPEEADKIEWLEHGVAVCGFVASSRQAMVCEDILRRNDALTDLVKSYGIQAYCCHPLLVQDRLIGTLSFGRRSGPRFAPEEIELMASVTDLVAVAMSRVETDTRLRDSEARFRMFAELAPLGIVISDGQENTLFANPRFTELFGYTVDDMPSVRQWWDLAYPDEGLRDKARCEWREAVAAATRDGSEIRPVEYPVRCKDGGVRHVEFRAAGTGSLNVVIFTDVTERRKAEAEQERLQSQLLQAQKMESVGRLAGGVAHDFNNMLNVIMGFADLALEQTDPASPLHADLQEVLKAAGRAADVTRQLLTFARRQTIDPRAIDLNEALEDMLRMLRRLLGEDIDLLWQPGSGRMTVFMDPSQLDQVLANLCVNARDAIEGVGKLTIETGRVAFDEEYCAEHVGFVPGDFIMLAVSDDGCGMDPDTLENVFDPFFTTKDLGEGTGLGLATVFGIVKQSGGFINVYSEPGSGTTFRVYLRPHVGDADRTMAKDVDEIPAGRGETVMVVEDEDAILTLTRKILERLGYVVLTASAPGEAVALAEEHDNLIHLVITDVIMPEMNGRDLGRELKVRYPDLKVLFMSGYTANVIAHQGVLDEGVHFLQKPFSNRELGLAVREALDG